MSDCMPERVAMAIKTAVVKINGGRTPDNLNIETEPFDSRELEVAYAVLAAIREPTEAAYDELIRLREVLSAAQDYIDLVRQNHWPKAIPRRQHHPRHRCRFEQFRPKAMSAIVEARNHDRGGSEKEKEKEAPPVADACQEDSREASEGW